MHYIIFDLEATCWKNKQEAPGKPEIIEIGAVKLDSNGNEMDKLKQFVKPTHFPELSEFCTELTSITQDMVDSAPNFPKAIQIFRDWIGFDEHFVLCSWGDYDRKQLKGEAEMHDIPSDWCNKHINLKAQYAEIKMQKKQKGMKKVLEAEGISLTGTHHRGIDDAVNITKIFKQYFGFWDIQVDK